jgi:hypothetical protein
MAAPAMTFSAIASRLADLSTPPDEVLKTLGELRDRLDVVHSPEYSRFLEFMLQTLIGLLTRTVAQFQEGTVHRYAVRLLVRVVSVCVTV